MFLHMRRSYTAAGALPGEPVTARLVAEMAAVGGHHRGARRVDGGHHLGVADRAPWLDDRADARVHRQLRAVGEGEVGIGGKRRPRQPRGLEGLSLLDGDPYGVDPAHLAGADPD